MASTFTHPSHPIFVLDTMAGEGEQHLGFRRVRKEGQGWQKGLEEREKSRASHRHLSNHPETRTQLHQAKKKKKRCKTQNKIPLGLGNGEELD